jgi:hypothetical protein
VHISAEVHGDKRFERTLIKNDFDFVRLGEEDEHFVLKKSTEIDLKK